MDQSSRDLFPAAQFPGGGRHRGRDGMRGTAVAR